MWEKESKAPIQSCCRSNTDKIKMLNELQNEERERENVT